ncbi:MAG: glycogen/starch/alpha-glucan phosphorylase, partial [Gallintestinimicrobium sp.]
MPLSYLEKGSSAVPIIKDNCPCCCKKASKVQIIDDQNRVHMAHMDIHWLLRKRRAAIHTEILKDTELHAFYEIYPEKFNNKTNGITFRRWLLSCNRELAALITEKIGTGYQKDAMELEKLLAFKDDEEFLNDLVKIKRE